MLEFLDNLHCTSKQCALPHMSTVIPLFICANIDCTSKKVCACPVCTVESRFLQMKTIIQTQTRVTHYIHIPYRPLETAQEILWRSWGFKIRIFQLWHSHFWSIVYIWRRNIWTEKFKTNRLLIIHSSYIHFVNKESLFTHSKSDIKWILIIINVNIDIHFCK